MTNLKELVIAAHGGQERWKAFERVTVDLQQGGALWSLKGQPHTLETTSVTVGLRKQWASHFPFGSDGLRSTFEPDRVALAAVDGSIVQELANPRESFAWHVLQTPWDQLQLAYFAGCAMWTYLNMPFLLAWPGVETEELEPWPTAAGAWRRLTVRLPASIATHSPVQTLYVDADGLLKRHDYDVQIAGNTPGAHLVSDYVDVSGIKFPTKRRIFARQGDGGYAAEPLVVSIDLSNFQLE